MRRDGLRSTLIIPAILLQLLVFVSVAAAASLWTVDGTGGLNLDDPLLDRLLDGDSRAIDLAVLGSTHRVEVTDVTTGRIGVRSLRGIVDGDAEAFFLLCRAVDGATAAFFRVPGEADYRLGRHEGDYRLEAIEQEEFTPCGGALSLPATVNPGARAEEARPPTRAERAVADDGSRHDVLIAYTPKTRTAAGGVSQIEAEIQLAVDAANLVYANSGVGATLRLVHCLETPYDENDAWVYKDHIDWLFDPSDGRMDELHELRNRTGADFLSLIVENTDALGNPMPGCGIGYVMNGEWVGPQFEPGALSVVTRSCASAVWTLAHELGHNRGCAHNREDSDNEGAYPYSYGHRFTGDDGNGYRTVMSYDTDPSSFERIPYFSNPGIHYQGQPTGVPVGDPDEAHCALTHVNTNGICAGFRHEHTFVDLEGTGGGTGFIDAPFNTIEAGLGGSRDGGWLTLQGSLLGFTGLLPVEHRVYVRDGAGSTVIGAP